MTMVKPAAATIVERIAEVNFMINEWVELRVSDPNLSWGFYGALKES